MALSTGKKNLYVYDLNEGEYIRLRAVDFGKKAARTFSLTAAVAGTPGAEANVSAAPNGPRRGAAALPGSATISIHLDAPGGPLLGTVELTPTGGTDTYRAFKTAIAPKLATGVHDLYLCIDQARGDVRLDWWQFGK